MVNKTHLDRDEAGGKNIGMPPDERVLIGDVERRLAKKYSALPQDHITAVVRDAYARLQSSPVRGFIPLLVERCADEELEELSVLRPDLSAVAFGDLAADGQQDSGVASVS
ncbi:three-helix bundle dimerization domain-containing protein [Mycobacterium sp.]|uniref:three-helix bundle dimerization domain-containing protein n=1 Tax=Mycobacterium sp. TaxID=1785 RepID=UPI003C783A04